MLATKDKGCAASSAKIAVEVVGREIVGGTAKSLVFSPRAAKRAQKRQNVELIDMPPFSTKYPRNFDGLVNEIDHKLGETGLKVNKSCFMQNFT
jgi:hypothetical protein